MINNDILRSLRYTFDFDDKAMINIFSLAGKIVLRDELCAWLKKDEDSSFKSCSDKDFLSYLNGFILYKRGKQDKAIQETSQILTNNLILKKIKIALSLKSVDILSLLDLVDIKISKHELSALFRHKDHKNYRECKDQFLRNFLRGLQKKYRPTS